jgi:hypothetical protein
VLILRPELEPALEFYGLYFLFHESFHRGVWNGKDWERSSKILQGCVHHLLGITGFESEVFHVSCIFGLRVFAKVYDVTTVTL